MFFLLLVLILLPNLAEADKHYYSLNVFGASGYTDNLYLTESDKEDDVISEGGLTFSADKATKISDLSFQYNVSRSFYWSNSEDSAFRHNLSLNYSRSFSKKTAMRSTISYYRTEQSIEPSEQVFRERRRSRKPYYRFNGDFSFEYEYLKDSFLTLGLSLNYLQNKDPSVEDSRIYSEYFTLSKDFIWWFVKGGMFFTQREFETQNPVNTWGTNLSLGYKLAHNKHISLGLSADRTQNIGKDENDYWAYRVDLTYSWQPTKDQNYHFSLGYYLRDKDGSGKENEGITFSVDYTKRYKLTSFSLSGSGGYRYEYAEAQNTGFTEYYNLTFSLSRELSRTLTLSSSCFYRIENFKDQGSQKEKTYGLTLVLSKQLTKKLSGSLSYTYRQADSDLPDEDYKVNTVFLSISYLFWHSKEFPFKLWRF